MVGNGNKVGVATKVVTAAFFTICLVLAIILAALYGTRVLCKDADKAAEKIRLAKIPTMVRFGQIKDTKELATVLGANNNVKASMKNIAYSLVPGAEMYGGVFKLTPGAELEYVQLYEAMVVVLYGTLTVKDGSGINFAAKGGDNFYIPRGAKVSYKATTSSMMYYVNQPADPTMATYLNYRMQVKERIVRAENFNTAKNKLALYVNKYKSLSYLNDTLISKVKGKEMAGGLYKLLKGPSLLYTYEYEEFKYIVEGEFHLKDVNGKLTVAKGGDLMYFPKGTYVDFSSPSSALGFFVGQRTGGVTVQGRIITPSTFTILSRPSCLTIKIQASSPTCPTLTCLPRLIQKETFDVESGTEDTRYSVLIPNAQPVNYFISAVLNNGWCAERNIPLAEGDKFRDLYSSVINEFQVERNGSRMFEKNIELEPFTDKSIGVVTLHGKIKVPSTLDRNSSRQSCLILQVREFNPGFHGNTGIDRLFSQHITHQLQYEGEYLHYAIQLQNVKYQGRYQVDAIMNVGWCSAEISGANVLLRNGDYHNGNIEDFMIKPGQRLYEYNFELVEYKTEPSTVPSGITIFGKVVLPEDAHLLPTNSCLTIQIKEFRECTGLTCPSPTLVRTTFNDIKVVNNVVNYDLLMPNTTFGHYIITAVINNGWCSNGYTQGTNEWIRNGDFINEEVRHFIIVPRQVELQIDIKLNYFVKIRSATPPAPVITTTTATTTTTNEPPPPPPPATSTETPSAPETSPSTTAPQPVQTVSSPAAPIIPAETVTAAPPSNASMTVAAEPAPQVAKNGNSITATSSDGKFDYQFTLLTNPDYVGEKNQSDDQYVYRTGLLSVNSSTAPLTNESDAHFITLPNGLPKSCQGIRDAGIGNIDGQYIIEARPSCHISVICVNMDDENTKEFLGGPSEEEWKYWHYAVLIKISEADKRNLPQGACLEASSQGRELLHRILVAGAREGNPISQWKTKISNYIRKKRNLPDHVTIMTKPRLIRKGRKRRMWTSK